MNKNLTRVLAATVVLVLVAACGNVVRGSHRAHLFSVVASIRVDAGGTACVIGGFPTLTSSIAAIIEPKSCPIPLHGLTDTPLANSSSLPGGGFATTLLELTGTWGRNGLTLDHQPTPTTKSPRAFVTVWTTDAKRTAEVAGGQCTADGEEDVDKIHLADAQLLDKGIVMIGYGCAAVGLMAEVVAADQTTAHYLHDNFDVATVRSWMTPIT